MSNFYINIIVIPVNATRSANNRTVVVMTSFTSVNMHTYIRQKEDKLAKEKTVGHDRGHLSCARVVVIVTALVIVPV